MTESVKRVLVVMKLQQGGVALQREHDYSLVNSVQENVAKILQTMKVVISPRQSDPEGQESASACCKNEKISSS